MEVHYSSPILYRGDLVEGSTILPECYRKKRVGIEHYFQMLVMQGEECITCGDDLLLVHKLTLDNETHVKVNIGTPQK